MYLPFIVLKNKFYLRRETKNSIVWCYAEQELNTPLNDAYQVKSDSRESLRYEHRFDPMPRDFTDFLRQ